MNPTAADALLAARGDEDAEARMTLILAAEARAEQPLPESGTRDIFKGDSLVKALRHWRGKTQGGLKFELQPNGNNVVRLD